MLAIAAVASSIARPPEDDGGGSDDPPAAATGRGGGERPSRSTGVVTLRLRAGAEPRTLALAQGLPATLLVSVPAPGDVEIPGLGLLEPAEPLTPARFDILAERPESHRILLRRASESGDGSGSMIGTLKVEARR